MTSSLNGFGGLRGPTGKIGNKTPSGYKAGQLQQFTPEQQQLFQQLFSHLGPESYLGRLAGGSEETFEQQEAPALRQFAELQGGLASRFSGMGTGGRHSSGFQNLATAGASNFAQDLASKRHELQRQAIYDLMGLSHQLLGERPYETYLQPKKQSFLETLFGTAPKETLGFLGSGIKGAITGGLTGGLPGAGYGALSGFGQHFL